LAGVNLAMVDFTTSTDQSVAAIAGEASAGRASAAPAEPSSTERRVGKGILRAAVAADQMHREVKHRIGQVVNFPFRGTPR
jgi:hypothetical protein